MRTVFAIGRLVTISCGDMMHWLSPDAISLTLPGHGVEDGEESTWNVFSGLGNWRKLYVMVASSRIQHDYNPHSFIVRSKQLPWVVIATHCFYTPPHRLSIYFWRGYIAQSLASKVLSLIRNEAPGFAPHKRERFIWRASKVLLTVSKYLYLLSTLNQRYRFSLVPCPIASVNTAF